MCAQYTLINSLNLDLCGTVMDSQNRAPWNKFIFEVSARDESYPDAIPSLQQAPGLFFELSLKNRPALSATRYHVLTCHKGLFPIQQRDIVQDSCRLTRSTVNS
jgi:hypothetical protein